MTIPYSMRQQGWMLVDNGGPCITEEQARALNLPLDYARKSVVECDLLHCKCCGGLQLKNPDRVRPRYHCNKCNWFQCDACAYQATLPGYVHESFDAKADRVKTQMSNLGEL
jgi:hypothetical protein